LWKVSTVTLAKGTTSALWKSAASAASH
jgi:hypothetical protein